MAFSNSDNGLLINELLRTWVDLLKVVFFDNYKKDLKLKTKKNHQKNIL